MIQICKALYVHGCSSEKLQWLIKKYTKVILEVLKLITLDKTKQQWSIVVKNTKQMMQVIRWHFYIHFYDGNGSQHFGNLNHNNQGITFCKVIQGNSMSWECTLASQNLLITLTNFLLPGNGNL